MLSYIDYAQEQEFLKNLHDHSFFCSCCVWFLRQKAEICCLHVVYAHKRNFQTDVNCRMDKSEDIRGLALFDSMLSRTESPDFKSRCFAQKSSFCKTRNNMKSFPRVNYRKELTAGLTDFPLDQ